MSTFEQLELRHGSLAFSALAMGEGPVVLCLHGFPDNARSYRHQLPALADAGYRAISLTLRGYETSSIPTDGDYTLAACAADVLAAIDQLGEEQVHLVGHDWGAAIAYRAAALAPQRFNSLTTLAVPHIGRFFTEMIAHPKQLGMSWYMFFFQLRGIAEYVVSRDDYAFIRMLWRRWSPGWEPPESEIRRVIEGLRQPGVTRAALGYYRAAMGLRSLPVSRNARAQARIKVSVPTMGITGEREGCIDTSVFQKMMKPEDFPAGMVVRKIAEAGHFPHQEQVGEVNTILLEWIDRHRDG